MLEMGRCGVRMAEVIRNRLCWAGGFHLYKTPEEQVRPIIAELHQLGVQRVMPAHCTGDVASELFRAAFAGNCLEAGAGQTVSMASA